MEQKMQPEAPDLKQEKQRGLQDMTSRVMTVLGELDALHLPSQGQAEKLIQYIQENHRDSALATDESDLERLYSELRGYTGAEFSKYAAARIQVMQDREGWYTDKKSFQEKIAVRKNALHGFKMFPGNYGFSYGVIPEMKMAHIHLTNPYINKTENTFSGSEGAAALRMFLKGLIRFALEVVTRDEDIHEITATSPILARQEFADFMEKIGFRNKGEMGKEFHEQHFREEKRKVIGMNATREDFLQAIQATDFKKLQLEAIKILRSLKEDG